MPPSSEQGRPGHPPGAEIGIKMEGAEMDVIRPIVRMAVLTVIAAILAAYLALGSPLRAQDAKPAASNPTTKRLKLGKRVKVKMRGGQSRSYAIHADAGQFVHVVVEQKGIDLTLTLLDPAGKQIAQSHMPGHEPISTIAETGGDFHLQVSPFAKEAPKGSYTVQLTDLRVPTALDRTRAAAERAYMEGEQLFDRKEFETAAPKWEESARLWHSLEDGYGQSISFRRLGAFYHQLQDERKSLDYLMEALSLELKVGDRPGEATTRRNIGAVYSALGEKQKALDYYNQALPLQLALGDRAGEARTLTNIGAVLTDTGEQRKALDYYNRALPIARSVRDHATEAITLNNIGAAYSGTGDLPKALESFVQALAIARSMGDSANEAHLLINIGVIYAQIGEQQKALDYYNQALPVERGAMDRADEALTLSNIGLAYADLGEEQIALDYYKQALPLHRAVGNRVAEARTLLYIGAVSADLGEKQKALDYYNQSLPIQRAAEDRAGEALTLKSIGNTYYDLGEKQRAMDYYNQALILDRAVGDRDAQAGTLSNIGGVYLDLGEKQKALDYFDQALSLERAVGDRDSEAITLENVGHAYSDLGEKQKALDYFNQALTLDRAVGDRAQEASTLREIGEVEFSMGEKQKALDFYTQSLPLFRAVQNPLAEGRALVDLMEYWKNLQNPNLAVLFGKQAVDRFQQVRRNIGGLEKDAQQSFLKSNEDYYRELAELLISQGRLPEAQQVLDLLKAEEYSDFTQRRGNAGSDANPVALTPMEEKSNQEYEKITKNITAIGSEWTQLRAKSSRSPAEEKRYSELSNNLTTARQRLEEFLKGLYDSFGKGDQANAKVENVREETAGLQNLVGELGAGTTVVYTLVLDEKAVEMVITPATQVAREVTISKSALRGKVFAFTHSLAEHNSEDDIRAKAQDLYNILIAPIEKDLQGAQAKTLVWSLDDALRYVPLAALYDGKQYLVERYQNVVITTASAGNLKDQPQVSSWRGAAMGVSKDYDGLGQLKAVPGELASVVHSDTSAGSHGPVPGVILLDDFFTETRMESEMEHHPPLIHIASHYVFQPGDDTKSYLLLGGKETGGQGFHLTLAELRDDQKIDFKGIELLTLSGCQTAVGSNDSDGREIDGLGITAQRKGAKAVVATLWPVDDASVGLLMATFYKLWITTPGMTKVEALRQAQLKIMRGTTDPAGASRGISKTESSASESKNSTASPYANPFYWAPFILIGNWK